MVELHSCDVRKEVLVILFSFGLSNLLLCISVFFKYTHGYCDYSLEGFIILIIDHGAKNFKVRL